MYDEFEWGAEYFDRAYLATADGIRELQEMYDSCPVAFYPGEGDNGGDYLQVNPLMGDLPMLQRVDEYVRGFYSLELRGALEAALHSGRVNFHCGGDNVPVSVSDIMIDDMYKCRGVESDAYVIWLKENDDDPVVQIDVMMSANVSLPMGATCSPSAQRMKFRMVTYLNVLTQNFITTPNVCLARDAVRQKGIPLDDYLVPYLGISDMDREAERLLCLWFPSVQKENRRLDVKRLLSKLHMNVCFARITRELKFQGRVFFEDCDTVVYDANDMAVPFHATKGTILVDERMANRPEAVLWTIIHEIYHFVQHKEFFYLQKIYNGTLKFLSCDIQDYRQLDRNSPLYWVEWQTERITARLIMPLDYTKAMAARLLDDYSCYGKTGAMERTIRAIASYYGVSVQAAKYRMTEMGFREARGIFNFVDNGYVPAYYGIEDGLQNRTPDISEDAALELYISDPDFRSIIDTGRYCFVEKHFCVNSPKYIMRGKNGEPCLTKYARNHIDECCIIFERVLGNHLYTYSREALNSEVIYRGPELYRPIDIPADRPMKPEERIGKRLEIYLDAIEHTPLRFGSALEYHRKHRGFSQEMLAELVDISVKQVGNYECSRVKQPAQRTVIAMCIAMKLEADLSDDLLKKGRCMPGTEREDLILLYVIHAMVEYSIPYCNRFLISKDVAPLTVDRTEMAVEVS